MSAPETVRSSMRTILRHLRKLPSNGQSQQVRAGHLACCTLHLACCMMHSACDDLPRSTCTRLRRLIGKLTSPLSSPLFLCFALQALHIRNQFQQHKSEANDLVATRMRENAKCYATLVSSIQELKTLRALDTGDKLKPRDHINATAARVGFSMPSYSDENVPDFTQPLPKSVKMPSRFGQDVHFGQQPKVPMIGTPSN